MGYTHRSVDSLKGDEPEIDALANRAEAGRDVDAEIDRRQAMMDAEQDKRNEAERMKSLRDDIRYRAASLISDIAYLIKWTDTPQILGPYSADNIVTQAESLRATCRKLAK